MEAIRVLCSPFCGASGYGWCSAYPLTYGARYVRNVFLEPLVRWSSAISRSIRSAESFGLQLFRAFRARGGVGFPACYVITLSDLREPNYETIIDGSSPGLVNRVLVQPIQDISSSTLQCRTVDTRSPLLSNVKLNVKRMLKTVSLATVHQTLAAVSCSLLSFLKSSTVGFISGAYPLVVRPILRPHELHWYCVPEA